MGPLVETAIFSQWFHNERALYYACWKNGEVDIVSLNSVMKPLWAIEVKWSDRFYDHPEQLNSLSAFCRSHNLTSALVTTRTIKGTKTIENTTLKYWPASLYCYALGYSIVKSKKRTM